MAGVNWSGLQTTTLYVDYTTQVTSQDKSALTWLDSSLAADTNIPTEAKRWNATNYNWEKWNGSAWTALAATYGISISGGAYRAKGLYRSDAANDNYNVQSRWNYHIAGYWGLAGFSSDTAFHAECSVALAINSNTLQGASPYETAGVASRIVKADAAGYIRNTYYQMTADVTAAPASHIAMEHSGDNFLRWQTPAVFLENSGVSGVYKGVLTNTDMNTLMVNGVYDSHSPNGGIYAIANLPLNQYGVIEVIGETFKTQMFHAYNGQFFYRSTYMPTGWSGIPWKEVLTHQSIYPVGCIYTTTVATNPATVFGFGTWTAFGEGRVLIGAGGGFTAGATGGSADAVVPNHTHTINDPGHTHRLGGSTSSGGIMETQIGVNTTTVSAHADSNVTGISVNAAGVSPTNANLPPYIVVYMWIRTA